MKKLHWRRLFSFFNDDEVATYSAAMSFYLIFAAIPVLYLLVTILTALPLFPNLYGEFHTFLAHHLMPSSQQELSSYLNSFLENSAAMGWMGALSLVVAAGLFFLSLDSAVSHIMRTPPRPQWHSILLYAALLLFAPIVIGVWLFLSALAPESYLPSWLRLPIPYAWLESFTLFYLSYQILPSRTIPTRAALWASLGASILFEAAKVGFVYYMRYATSYTLYGSFAALLFFFLWIYFSWQIFFFGLKLCRILAIPVAQEKEEHPQDGDNPKQPPITDGRHRKP